MFERNLLKRLASLLTALLLLPAAAPAEEEIEELELSEGDWIPSSVTSVILTHEPESYWDTPMDITDEAAVWKMLTQPITVVHTGKNSDSRSQTYLYLEPDKNSAKVGVVTCESQGVNVLESNDDGWSLVQCYSSSFVDTAVEAWAMLVQGWIPTSYLVEKEVNQEVALVVDKLSQRLYVFKDGALYSTLQVSTGVAMWNGEKYQPYNETRSGEFLLISRTGGFGSDNMYCEMGIRFNAGDMIHQVPYITTSSGSKDYATCEAKLGTKASHGCIRVQRKKTPEGVNMKWIWDYVGKSKTYVRMVVWEDWQGRQLETPSDSLTLYYNPNGGSYYHRAETCYSASGRTFTAFTYGELDTGDFAKLKYCPYCCPALRKTDIEAVNAQYVSGGDHDELLTSLRQSYILDMAVLGVDTGY